VKSNGQPKHGAENKTKIYRDDQGESSDAMGTHHDVTHLIACVPVDYRQWTSRLDSSRSLTSSVDS
ncbi:hypothetical protein BS47DRAFT_1356903, partial [Hydnum rufescens UP504]